MLAVGMRSTACMAPLGETHTETPIDYIMWRITEDDGCKSLEFKTDELSVDKSTSRAANGALTVCQARFVAVLILGETRRLNKTKLVLWCQMLFATFEHEMKWQFKALDQNTWAERKSLPRVTADKCSMSTNDRQPRKAS